jgi:flagellin
MSISIQTDVASLNAQYYVGVNNAFQKTAIEQLSSGYKINSSADDPAGLALANQYSGEITQLTQGVQNATDGTSTLQIADGGLSNISQILGRLQTLASESASGTFQGNRATVNQEYQGLLTEINRQAANIGLNLGGVNNTNLTVYTGGGSTQANSQVDVDLSGANNAVDATSLGIGATSVAGGGTGISVGAVANGVRLDNAATTFLASGTQSFIFNLNTGTGGDQVVTATLNPNSLAAGLNGAGVISSLNTQLQAYGITASISSAGTLQFGGATAFTVNTTAAVTGNAVSSTGSAINSANYNVDSGAFSAIQAGAETDVFQTASGTTTVSLDAGVNTAATDGSTQALALVALNTQLAGTGITAVTDSAGTGFSFQSTGVFSVTQTAAAGTGSLFAPGAHPVTAASTTASSTGSALAALTALTQAVSNLGLVQGQVGAGENKLQYATNLAQSQITNVSAAESGIRDADVAAAAANLTKAQVLQQTSLAALSQANSAPQSVLALLKNF